MISTGTPSSGRERAVGPEAVAAVGLHADEVVVARRLEERIEALGARASSRRASPPGTAW